MSALPVDDVPVALDVEPLVVLAVLPFATPLCVVALFWAVFMGLDELVSLLLALLSALVAGGLGGVLE